MLLILKAFLVGSAAGGVLARRLEADRHRWVACALAVEAGGLCLAAVGAALAISGYVIVGLLAVAMGVRNATVRRLAVPDLTTTVLTMTLAGLAADMVGGAGSKRVPSRRIAAVVAMLVGAFAGAVLLGYGLFAPLTVAGAVLVLTLAGFLATGRQHERGSGADAFRRAA